MQIVYVYIYIFVCVCVSVISYAYVIICVYTYMHEWILGQILSKGSDQRCRISVKDNPGSASRINGRDERDGRDEGFFRVCFYGFL